MHRDFRVYDIYIILVRIKELIVSELIKLS